MQILNQALPVPFMDQGPFVAAGIPAVGYTANYPPEAVELHWVTYHTPGDTVDIQTAESLKRSGRALEALVDSLLARESFPSESGPYLYFEESNRVLQGIPLSAIFVAVVAIFGVGSFLPRRRSGGNVVAGWVAALPQYLGLWLPLLASVLLTYAMVAVGLMQVYAVSPAAAKAPEIFEPRWPAVFVFGAGLAGMIWLGRRAAARVTARAGTADFAARKSLAMVDIALVGLYLLVANRFSLVFLLPLFSWYGIAGRHGVDRWLDFLSLLLGGLLIFALIYFFGFVILRNGLAGLWYVLMMFSIRMISFPAALAITATLAAGLSLVVTPPRAEGGHRRIGR
jgi:hypothetical protein